MKKAIALVFTLAAIGVLLPGCGPPRDAVDIHDQALRYVFSDSSLTMEQRTEMHEKYPSYYSGSYYAEDFSALAADMDAFMQEKGLAITQSFLDSIQMIIIWYNGEYNVVELHCQDGFDTNALLPYGVMIMSLEDFPHLKNLTHLELNNLSAVSLAPLMDMQGLEGLYINTDRVTDIELISEMTWLKGLGLSDAGLLKSALLEPLAGLESIYLRNASIDSLDFLGNKDNLERLFLTDVAIIDGSATAIAALPNLKRLVIENTPIRRLDVLRGIEYDYYRQDGETIYGP